jgi:uncharacterized protein (TIGR01440 family)
MYDEIAEQAKTAVSELIKAANLKKDDIMVIGCSSSEIGGHKIGSFSSVEIANSVFNAIYPILKNNGIYLAAQCCEHLNRSIIIEKEAALKNRLEIVNVIPRPKAGGSFATAAYENFENPAAVEEVKAQAGIDIGGTLIGMHLAKVAVPVRLSVSQIGEANIVCARTRPKFVGGGRACYDEKLM